MPQITPSQININPVTLVGRIGSDFGPAQEIILGDTLQFGSNFLDINLSSGALADALTDLYSYIETAVQGIDAKASVKTATTANISLSTLQTIGGVAVVAGDRVLVKNQTTASQNGIWIANANQWTRATDMNLWSEVPGAYAFVESGTLAGTGWVCTSQAGGTINSTAITWSQFSGSGSYVADSTSGITISGVNVSLSQMPARTLKGNAGGATAAPTDLSVSAVRSLLTINNLDNTSDASKPVSTAQQAALNLKAPINAPVFTTSISLGDLTDSSTATPLDLSLGGTYSNTAGQKLKLLTYETSSNYAGLGVSLSQMDYSMSFAGSHVFYAAGAEKFRIDALGNVAATGTLSGTNFSGTSSGTNTGDQTTITGNAGTATKLQSARSISATGDLTWSTSFDGSGNATGTATLASVNTNVGSFGSAASVPVLTVNAKGLITAVSTAALGTAATQNTGTSGATVPLLNAANTWSAGQTINGFLRANSLVGLPGNDGQVEVGGDGNGNIELGKTGRVNPGTPFIDFHSSANSPDYDVRIIASGGSSTVGQGSVSFFAAAATFTGSLSVSGPITASNIISETRTLPVTVNDCVNIGSFYINNGAFSLAIGIVVSSGSFSISDNFLLTSAYNATGTAWHIVPPLVNTGAFSGNDIQLEANHSNNTLTLRIRRLSGTTAGVAYVTMLNIGSFTGTYTASTSVTAAAAAVSTYHVGSSLDASNLRYGLLPVARLPVFDGDITSPAGSATITLKNVNANVGTYGGAGVIPIVTVNAKGLVTSVTTANSGNSVGYDVGTSGATIPLLSGTNTWSNAQTMNSNLNVLGNIGIGISSGSPRLTISAGDQQNARIRINNSGSTSNRSYDLVAGWTNETQDGFSIYDTVAGVTRMTIDNNGMMTARAGLTVTNGIAPPSVGTRSVGTRVVYYSQVSASEVDYAVGMDGSTLWHSVPSRTGYFFRWYGGNTEAAALSGAGDLYIKGNMYVPLNQAIYITNNGSNGLQLIGRSGAENIIGTLGASESLYLRTNSAERMRIDAAGFIGINTGRVPATRLHIEGANNSTGSTLQILGTGISAILLGQDSEGGIIRSTGGSSVIKFLVGGSFDTTASAGSEIARVTNQGLSANKIGIGTNSPAAPLDIANASSTVAYTIQAILSRFQGDGNFALTIRTGSTTNGAGQIISRISSLYGTTDNGNINFHRGGGAGDGFMTFSTGSTDTERVRITTEGNVGIGIPAVYNSRLVVNGQTQITEANVFPDTMSYSTFGVTRAATANLPAYIAMTRAGNTVFAFGIDASNNFNLGQPNGSQIITPLMTVTGGGNVGIGTTGPGYRLEVRGDTSNFYGNSNPSSVTAARQITVGEASNNGTYRMALGYFNDGIRWSGVINAFANNNPTPLLLNPQGGVVAVGKATAGSALDVAGEVRSARYTNDGPSGTSQENARNHFRSYNAGSQALVAGWIAAAFGDASGSRVVIGQGGGSAVLGGHSGNLDAWSNLIINPANSGNVGIGSYDASGRLSVATNNDSNPGSVGTWDTRHMIVGQGNSGALAFSYSSSLGDSIISSLSPNVSWRGLRLQAANLKFYVSGDATPKFTLDGSTVSFGVSMTARDVNGRDMTADRGDGTGVIYLNGARNRYLYWNNSTYVMPDAALVVNGLNINAAINDLKTNLVSGRQSALYGGNKAAGWYTIAVNPGDRASARFGLRDTSSGNHQSVVFYATHFFGQSNTIKIINQGSYGGTPFRFMRIKYGGVYDGAMLQVYIDGDNTNCDVEVELLGDNHQASGWTLINWVADGTNPGGLNAYASLTSVSTQIDLDEAPQGSIFSSTVKADSLLIGFKGVGGTPTPTFIRMDNSYRNSVGNSDNLKLYLYREGTTNNFGFGVNNGGGIEYHASSSTAGNHDFYTAGVRRMKISSDGVDVGTTPFFATNGVWNKRIRFGGDPNTDTGASVTVTTGNIHLDPAAGSGLYLNYYRGTGVIIGNGAGGELYSLNTTDITHSPSGGQYVRTNKGFAFTASNTFQPIQYLRDGFTQVGTGGDSGVANPSVYQWGYQEAGPWNHPYPDLVLAYHTGIKMGAVPSYGGVRFYDNHPAASSTILFSVGNGDAHIRVTNDLYVGGTLLPTNIAMGDRPIYLRSSGDTNHLIQRGYETNFGQVDGIAHRFYMYLSMRSSQTGKYAFLVNGASNEIFVNEAGSTTTFNGPVLIAAPGTNGIYK